VKNWSYHLVTMSGGYDSYDTYGYSSYHAGAPPTATSACTFYVAYSSNSALRLENKIILYLDANRHYFVISLRAVCSQCSHEFSHWSIAEVIAFTRMSLKLAPSNIIDVCLSVLGVSVMR